MENFDALILSLGGSENVSREACYPPIEPHALF